MKKHVKIYMDFFDYQPEDFIKSELSLTKAIDIHHISRRGIGGSKEKDYIENLMALNRKEHNDYGDKKQYMIFLYVKHFEFIASVRPEYRIRVERIPHMYYDEVIKEMNRIFQKEL